LPDPVPAELREERRARFMAVQEKISRKRLKRKIGKTLKVLVDTVDKLYRALCALSGDATLAAWDFLPRWPSLPRSERHVNVAKAFVVHPDRFDAVRGKKVVLVDDVMTTGASLHAAARALAQAGAAPRAARGRPDDCKCNACGA
jgi:phosphoribosylpyrophosphate synthetase